MKEVSEKKYGEIAYTFTTVSCYNYRFLDDGIEIIFNVSVRNKCSGSDEVNESLQQVRLGFNYYKDSIIINDYLNILISTSISIIFKQKKLIPIKKNIITDLYLQMN